jgi:hypothetical protein
VDLSGNRRLIIDWVGPPTQYAREGVDMPPQTGFSQGLGEVQTMNPKFSALHSLNPEN